MGAGLAMAMPYLLLRLVADFASVPAWLLRASEAGLLVSVLAIVLQAVHRVGSRALKTRPMITLAALAFIGIFFFAVPFPLMLKFAPFCCAGGFA